jgi:predicted Zn-dependent peptidase
MKERIEELFADWPASGTPSPGEPPLAEIRPGGGLYYAEKTGMANTWVVMGHVGIRADHPDYAAMKVLSEILGGDEASRLFNDIRSKRGLAYATGSSPGTDRARPRVLLGYAGTRSDSALVVLDLIRDEIRRARYPEKIAKLGVADLLAAAERNIHPDDLQVLVVGDKADFAAPLSSLGPYETIDLTIPEPPETTEIPAATPESLARGRELLEQAIESTGGAGG